MRAIVFGTVVVAIEPDPDTFAAYQRRGCTVVPCDASASVGDHFDGTRIVQIIERHIEAGTARERRRVARLTDQEFLQDLRENKR